MNGRELERAGLLSALDRALGEFLGGEGLVGLAAALVSRNLREGHVCLELARVGELLHETANSLSELPTRESLQRALEKSDAVACVGSTEKTEPRALDSQANRPLVLDAAGRLYFRRYFEHEQRLARALTALGRTANQDAVVPLAAERFDHYFGAQVGVDLQRRAAELASNCPFVIISGGPGTGKTATVVKILALLIEQAHQTNTPVPRALLLAPTGKAAARLKESIARAKGELGAPPEVLAAIVGEASTIHRALGVRPDSRTRFRRSSESPLPYDLVLVDEASMVDLSLMRHLVESLRPTTRLILLGDRYQLASVQAGSVLAELCAAFAGAAASRADSPVRNAAVVELTRSYRFAQDSGIFRLAEAVRTGNASLGLELLEASARPEGVLDLGFVDVTAPPQQQPELARAVVRGFSLALRAPTPEAALSALGAFRLLAAHRRGAYGVETLNELSRAWLVRAGLVPERGEFYRGRPLLITQNDYASGLYNGDVGLVWPDEQGQLTAFFEGAHGLRRFSPAHLPEHETAFAITVHKSQGSEYDEVVVVLPEEGSPLLSRELLYTAITRARRRVVLVGGQSAVIAACRRSVERSSGLGDAVARLVAHNRPGGSSHDGAPSS